MDQEEKNETIIDHDRIFEEIIESLLNGDANRALRRLEAMGYGVEDLLL